MKLTDSMVRSITATGRVQKLADGGGLFLHVTDKGRKSWRLAYRFAGKQKLLSIGPYPLISLREARQKRDEAKRLLLDNIDPSQARQEAKARQRAEAGNSFEAVSREWYAKQAGRWRPRYAQTLLSRLEKNLFPDLGKLPINRIDSRLLLQVLRKAENRGALTTLHRALQDCGRIFRYAVITGRAERDVAADLRGAFTPATGGHFAAIIDPAELGQLLRRLDNYHGNFYTAQLLRLAPLVFVRVSELVEAKWLEIDLQAGLWRIPAERMKMRQPHMVPLSCQARAVLARLEQEAKPLANDYVFPGKSRGSHLHQSTPLQALRALGYAGDKHTFHGFRTTASTLLNELGYNRDWIERQLAHSERDSVRAAYNYAQYLPERRQMMQDWADYLDDLKQGNARLRPAGSRQRLAVC